MPMPKFLQQEITVDSFPMRLKSWRHLRRLSQLDLALSSGVSQRHLSFLESGRARPSREMVLQLCETLNVPLRERNDLLVAAGFAPMFRSRPLDHPEMSRVLMAVHMMLSNHEPFPAVAIDCAWNIQMANAPFERLISMLAAEHSARAGGERVNLMRLFFHRDGIRPYIRNWADIAPLLWHRATREAEALGGDEMRQLLDELRPYQSSETLFCKEGASLLPVLPVEIEKDGVRISLFTVIATFGTAQDVNANELRIESLFPADDATNALFRGTFGGPQGVGP